MGAGHYYKILKKRLAMILHLDQQHGEQISEENGDGEPKPEKLAWLLNKAKLECTLEQFYNGCTRRIKIQRDVYDIYGRRRNVEEILYLYVMPGWKNETRITYPGKGGQVYGRPPTDLTLVLKEKPHAFFQREGHDLVVNLKISLVEALTGKTFHITTLDGRDLPIEVKDIVKSGYMMVVPNEGMPLIREPGNKGDLYIKFDVVHPSMLTTEQMDELKMILKEPLD